jgi:putative FmdB family regulatory protein
MPIYEFRCNRCDSVFDAKRSMAQSDEPIECPNGHSEVVRLLPMFSATGRHALGPTACGSPVAGACGGSCACGVS